MDLFDVHRDVNNNHLLISYLDENESKSGVLLYATRHFLFILLFVSLSLNLFSIFSCYLTLYFYSVYLFSSAFFYVCCCCWCFIFIFLLSLLVFVQPFYLLSIFYMYISVRYVFIHLIRIVPSICLIHYHLTIDLMFVYESIKYFASFLICSISTIAALSLNMFRFLYHSVSPLISILFNLVFIHNTETERILSSILTNTQHSYINNILSVVGAIGVHAYMGYM